MPGRDASPETLTVIRAESSVRWWLKDYGVYRSAQDEGEEVIRAHHYRDDCGEDQRLAGDFGAPHDVPAFFIGLQCGRIRA